MAALIRKLPAPVVFCLVVLVGFWFGILGNIVSVASRLQGVTPANNFSNWGELSLVIFELLGLAAVFWIGRIRGWSFAAWGFQPSWRLIGAGMLLYLAVFSVIFGAGALVAAFHPATARSYHPLVSQVSLPFLMLVVVVNPVYEETLEVGFFVQALQRYGMWLAVLASALFRASLHTYLGFPAVATNLFAGLVLGFVYWKWRRLWPLFVFHALADLTMFLQYHAA
jgi:membrane protease YdiL (CAAX protease family)